MIKLRHRDDRGGSNAGWLNSHHTFSFANYYDSEHMGHGPLRVINEDRVIPGAGFGAHSHRNMEIISYVLEGALEHKDSMGNSSVIKPGDIQRMSAGTGVTHSEYNHSQDEGVHFLQIWFLPEQQNITPSYEQKSIDIKDTHGKFKLAMSRDGRQDSVAINQDVDMYVGRFGQDDSTVFEIADGRLQWLQVARGSIQVNGMQLQQGDGIAVTDEKVLSFDRAEEAEVILFDMKR